MYILEPKSQTPLYMQLYEAMKNEIVSQMSVGEKLPSIRKIAQEYSLSKTTVESAFNQLYAEGYIESKTKSGYFVSDFNAKQLQQKGELLKPSKPSLQEWEYDFFPARLCSESFPLKTWKRLYNKAVDTSLDFGAYPSGQGESGLREEIAKYLTASRGVRCSSEQVILFSGFAESMGLIARLLQKRFSTFAMEHPGYHVARRVFEEYGYKIEKIAVGTNGVMLKDLEAGKAKLLYITPSHQYPTGVCIPLGERLKLLEWTEKNQGFIIEDDYDSEMSYKHKPVPALQGLDNNDRVIYIGTFSKSLSPALRVSYAVLPHQLLPLYKESLHFYFPSVSLSTQKTLELFMREGHWERHLRKIRNLNRKKHDLMKESLQNHLGDTMQILSEGGGLAILIFPACEFDMQKFIKKAKDAKLKIYFAKERSGGEFEALRMGFGGLKEDEIPHAVKAFAKVWFSCVSSSKTC